MTDRPDLAPDAPKLPAHDPRPGDPAGGMVYVDSEGVERDAYAYLLADGNLAVPGGRYGSDTRSCAPVALAVVEVMAEATGEPITVDVLDAAMSSVVNSSDDVLSLLLEHGDAAAIETVADAAWEHWTEEAREQGREAGRAAAAWVTDGNESDESRRRLLSMFDDGDPAAFDYLPRVPNLSGEFAGDPTPQSLVEGIVPAHYLESLEIDDGCADGADALTDLLASAFEDGVSEVFEPECEANLRRALGLEVGE